MFKSFRSLDIYRQVPKDQTESTFGGALISIVSLVIMVVLFISEIQNYLKVETTSKMFIDVNRGGEKLQVNMNIELTGLPCDIVSLDCQDVMGSHFVNVGGSLYKQRLDKNGKNIEEKLEISKNEVEEGHAGHNHNSGQTLDQNRLIRAFKEEEGCQLTGFILINKVPGNFHISSHAYSNMIGRVLRQAGKTALDLSHRINHLSFGGMEDIGQIQTKFEEGIFNPLDNVEKIKTKDLEGQGVMHQYYISVVPTTFETIQGKELYVHQFTANSNEIKTHMMPAIFFRYDLSPVTVKVSQFSGNIFHFLVQLCAIIGGVFTVSEIINRVCHSAHYHLVKKNQIGKLG